MTELTRRTVLGGAAAAATLVAAPAVNSPAQAAAPAAGKQAPGFYRYKVGSHEVTVVTDGVNKFALPDNMVTNATKAAVNAALAAVYMEPNVFVGPYNPIVVNTGAKLVLIDSGTGEANFAQSKGSAGQFLTNGSTPRESIP
jgi:hypothetical protein